MINEIYDIIIVIMVVSVVLIIYMSGAIDYIINYIRSRKGRVLVEHNKYADYEYWKYVQYFINGFKEESFEDNKGRKTVKRKDNRGNIILYNKDGDVALYTYDKLNRCIFIDVKEGDLEYKIWIEKSGINSSDNIVMYTDNEINDDIVIKTGKDLYIGAEALHKTDILNAVKKYKKEKQEKENEN